MNDADILGACPDHISIDGVFKATPHTEGAHRYVYLEASNEGLDYQGEVIVAKALSDSASYYLRSGNCDLEHYSKIGPKLGIPDYLSYEIGLPVEVRQSGRSTFVKGEIYQGTGPSAEKANIFWDSITNLVPKTPWYASVGGQSLEKAIETDPDTGARHAVIRKMRWSNTAFTRTPVNGHVEACSAMPVGAFAKAMTPGGLDVAKALTAGYGTDLAALTGGAAMRGQSLHGAPINYFDFRNKLAKAMRGGACGASPVSADLHAYAVKNFGMSPEEATQHVERFLRDIKKGTRSQA